MSVSGIGKSPSKVYAGDTSIMRLTLHKTMLIQLKFEACENIFLIKWFCVALVDASIPILILFLFTFVFRMELHGT